MLRKMVAFGTALAMLMISALPISASSVVAEQITATELLVYDPAFVESAEIVEKENGIQLTRTQKLNTRSVNEQYRKDVIQLFTASDEETNLWMAWLNSDQGSKTSPKENDNMNTVAAQFTLYYEKEVTALSNEYVTLTDIEGYIEIISSQIQVTEHRVSVEVDDTLTGTPLLPYTWSYTIPIEDWKAWSIAYGGSEDRLRDTDGLGFTATYEITVFRGRYGIDGDGSEWTLEIVNRLSLPVD